MTSFPLLSFPETIQDAISIKRGRPEARYIAGGGELMVEQNLGLINPSGYVSLRRIASLTDIKLTKDKLTIGAGATIAQLILDPSLSEISLLGLAARSFGTRQIRNRATLGGNIMSARSNRTFLPCLLALDASAIIYSLSGFREIALEDLIICDGQTCLENEELLVSISVPLTRGFQEYTMVGPRNAQYFPVASVAIVVDAKLRRVRIALGNAGVTAIRNRDAEGVINSSIDWTKPQINRRTAEHYANLVVSGCEPISDEYSSSEYKRHALGVMVRRSLLRAFGEAA